MCKWIIGFIILLSFMLLQSEESPDLAQIMIEHPEGGQDIIDIEWCYVPAGEYTKGAGDIINIIDYDYEIMKYEVTNQQYLDYLKVAIADGSLKISEYSVTVYYKGDSIYRPGRYKIVDGFSLGRIHKRGNSFKIEKGYENHPVECVLKYGMISYAEYYGWRLPNEEEWEKAARGKTGNTYPWGDTLILANANYSVARAKHQMEFRTTPVGFYNGQNYYGFQTIDSPSPYGCYDMCGNLWELVVSETKDAYIILRGGNWTSPIYGISDLYT